MTQETQKSNNSGNKFENRQRQFPPLNSELKSLPQLSDLSGNEVPPKIIHGLGNSATAKPEPKPGYSPAEEKRILRVQGQLEESLLGVAMGMSTLPFLQKDAITTLQFTPQLSDSWMDICRRDKRMLEATERLLKNSVWFGFWGVMATFGVAVASNHGINLLAPLGVKKKQEQAPTPDDILSEEQRAQLLILQMVERQTKRNAELDDQDI